MIDLKKQAEELAKQIEIEGCSTGYMFDEQISIPIFSQALLTAYNEGAGQFRERAARNAIDRTEADVIRAMSLTEGDP